MPGRKRPSWVGDCAERSLNVASASLHIIGNMEIVPKNMAYVYSDQMSHMYVCLHQSSQNGA